MKEKKLISLIKNSISPLASAYIGDDAAHIKASLEASGLLVSTDALVEGIHFLSTMQPYYLGWKTAAVNISDIAAMGGRPKYITLAASLPEKCYEDWVKEFLRGINECCEEYKVLLIGGDLTASNSIYLCATIVGEVIDGRIAKRSNAKPRHKIIVTGEFGSSAAGLWLLQNKQMGNPQYSKLIEAHQKPRPKVNEGFNLIHKLSANDSVSMMDSSDGLLDCLTQIAEQSKVKMSVDFERIPVDSNLLACSAEAGIEPKHWIIAGGEDYQLVATTDQVFDETKWKEIGFVSEGNGVEIFKNNEKLDLSIIKTFEHFKTVMNRGF
jgi:thiamine-monophosphate kinase